MKNCQYACDYYNVPAQIGRAVIAYGEPGVIAADRGNYIGILLDRDKPGNVGNYHPVDGIEYLDEFKPIRKLSKAQRKSKAKYDRYLEYGDGFESFIDYCRWDAEPERSWNGGCAI